MPPWQLRDSIQTVATASQRGVATCPSAPLLVPNPLIETLTTKPSGEDHLLMLQPVQLVWRNAGREQNSLRFIQR